MIVREIMTFDPYVVSATASMCPSSTKEHWSES
jgi:hypothetical protein